MSNLATDKMSEIVHHPHVMATDRQELLKKWLAKVIDERDEKQVALAKLLGLTTSQMNKTVNGTRNIKADELLIVAAYYDAELPRIPGYGQARLAKQSNDNAEDGPIYAEEDDELWTLAEQRVDAEEAKSGLMLTNEQYIDHIIKLYNILRRRKDT
ncbi:MAG: helix-turn-helix transcriptional regulator [Roseibium sp.]